MKNLSCYVMAVSTLLFACGNSSSDSGGAGGASTNGGAGGAQTTSSSGGSSTAPNAGGAAGSPSTLAGGSTGTGPVGASGLDGTRIVTQLGNSDSAKLCRWMEGVLGLVAGATPEAAYASGTWFIAQCPAGDTMHLWGSPALCNIGLPGGNALACQTFTVATFESCITTVASDLCMLDAVTQCTQFNECFPLIVEE